jgi:hypothetical protein
MMSEYLEALNSASQSWLSLEIRTTDGVVFRRIEGDCELQDHVLYSLPNTPGDLRLISLSRLESILGPALFQSIFSTMPTEKHILALEAHLASSFSDGPIIDDSGRRLLEEQLVANLDGLRIDIFSNEHPPPHFRVSYAGESNNFAIEDCRPLNGNALRKFFRNIKKWHNENKAVIEKCWNDMRPTGCTVGYVRQSSASNGQLNQE